MPAMRDLALLDEALQGLEQVVLLEDGSGCGVHEEHVDVVGAELAEAGFEAELAALSREKLSVSELVGGLALGGLAEARGRGGWRRGRRV